MPRSAVRPGPDPMTADQPGQAHAPPARWQPSLRRRTNPLAATCLGSSGVGIAFDQIVETTNDLVMLTDARLDLPGPTIFYVNPAFSLFTGYALSEVHGLPTRLLQGPGTSRTTLRGFAAMLHDGHEVRERILIYTKSGTPRWLDLRITPTRDSAGNVDRFVAIGRDVTREQRRLDELADIADRDTLTGVANRRAFMRQMQAELDRAALGHRSGPCLAFVDIDHFKQINDASGHDIGDAILFAVADRLSAGLRRADLLGRIGGEEFAVGMPDLPLNDAIAAAAAMRAAVAETPFATPGGSMRVTVSIGVAQASADDALTSLMRRADRAMYTAKQGGRDRVGYEACAPD